VETVKELSLQGPRSLDRFRRFRHNRFLLRRLLRLRLRIRLGGRFRLLLFFLGLVLFPIKPGFSGIGIG